MFDKEAKNIDAVIVAIPDVMHATAAMWAMERGKHVYDQKPLTRTIWEARTLTAAAAKYKVASQMGNQGYSNEGTRQCAEMIWAGEIGNVTEVHAWTNRPIWPQGLTELPKEAPVPDTLDWDTWLGISSMRPYSPAYLPGSWRGFFDFGCSYQRRMHSPGGQEFVYVSEEVDHPFRFSGARVDAAGEDFLV